MSGTKRRLRVLLWHWGRRGGGPRYTLELARVLAARDDLEVFLSLSRQAEIYTDFEGIPVSGRFDVDTYASLPEFTLRTLGAPLLRRRFGAFLRSAGIDVVFCTMDHLWNPLIAGTIRRSGALYFLTVHDATRHPGEDQRLRRWLLERDVSVSDGVLVLAESVRESLIAHHGYPRERTFLSKHGIFDYGRRETPRELPSDRPVRLLFFGRILPYKGLDLLLSALPLLRNEFPEVELEIWGEGDLSPYRALLAGVRGVRVENRWIGEGEIEGVFRRTDLAVLPYREASQSGVVPTAFAVGMPCVVTPIPGLREQVASDRTGFIAEDLRPAALARAIAAVICDGELYRRLSAGCLHEANGSLNWGGIGATVADTLWRLVELGARK